MSGGLKRKKSECGCEWKTLCSGYKRLLDLNHIHYSNCVECKFPIMEFEQTYCDICDEPLCKYEQDCINQHNESNCNKKKT